jgi:hypothetical protein
MIDEHGRAPAQRGQGPPALRLVARPHARASRIEHFQVAARVARGAADAAAHIDDERIEGAG